MWDVTDLLNQLEELYQYLSHRDYTELRQELEKARWNLPPYEKDLPDSSLFIKKLESLIERSIDDPTPCAALSEFLTLARTTNEAYLNEQRREAMQSFNREIETASLEVEKYSDELVKNKQDYQASKKNYPNIFKIYQKYDGFCDVICNHFTLNNSLDIRACLQFIPNAYVPRLVRGIHEMVKLKQQ